MGALLDMARKAATAPKQAKQPGDDWGYELADLAKMDMLICSICQWEGRPPEERAAMLQARRTMAPVRIPGELAALREAVKTAERLGIPI